MAGHINDELADKMRQASNGVRWKYKNEGGIRYVRGIDVKSGLLRVEGSSPYSYHEASLQGVLDVSLKTVRRNNTTVKPFNLFFKHPASHPVFNDKLVPPKNVELEALADSVLDDSQKEYVKDWDWSSASKNIAGARSLLAQGPDMPPFVADCLVDDLLDETEAPLDENMWSAFFDRDDVVFNQGVLASHSKNLMDDDKNVALFSIPKTITDPGFLTQLSFIEPPDGKTHDLCLDPEYGDNSAKYRKEVGKVFADFLYSKCMSFNRHYRAYVMKNNKKPSFQQAAELVQSSMKDASDSAAVFTTFKGFEKLEEMSMKKIRDNTARRMIWAPGQVEAILGKLLLKNVTLSSFKRYERGNAHGVEASNGGFTRMFRTMMENVRDKKSFDKFLEENDLYEDWDFTEMLKEFGWRDDDLKKWDLMQFQVYMLLNLQYFIYSYNWSDHLDADEANWLYLFVLLATIDTTVVSDLGFGPELFVRILASGLFLTASGGSKTHDTLSHSFSFKQTMVAFHMWRLIKEKYTFIDRDDDFYLLKKSYRAFKLGSPFVHFSDDFLQCCLRRGLAFGQLINRSAFFARMFGLEFKVEYRPWESVVGPPERSAMARFLLANLPHSDDVMLSRGCDSFFKAEDLQEPMNGIATSFQFMDYETRSVQWYPLTSTIYAPDNVKGKVGIKKRGVNFLRFHFLESQFEDKSFIIPIRDHYEMYHKLFFSKVAYKDPAQMLVKLRSYAYYTFQWPKTFNTFKRIHDAVRDKYFPDLGKITNDVLLKAEIPRKLGLSLEEVTADWADHSTVLSFFLPNKRRVFDDITDLRERILWSAYRSVEYDVWSLIRMKDIFVDIPGIYGVNYRTISDVDDYRKREKLGLKSIGRERKKPPPRRSVR